MKLVADFSNNNAPPNFELLQKAGLVGVMLKVSEGTAFRDPFFQPWSRAARNAGLRVGGYHFARPTKNDPKTEAALFAHLLGKIERRDFRPALDLEQNSGKLSWADLAAWAREFNQEVKRRTGSLPMLYASFGWLRSMSPATAIGGALWLANWSRNGLPFNPPVPKPWRSVHLHQYTDHGSVLGAKGATDLSQVLHLRPLLAHPILGRL